MPAAFPFFYIEPAKKQFADITRKFVGPVSAMELEKIAPIGNSPTFMALADFAKMAEPWMNTTIAIFEDKEANKAWGWVLEMYGEFITGRASWQFLCEFGNLILPFPVVDGCLSTMSVHMCY